MLNIVYCSLSLFFLRIVFATVFGSAETRVCANEYAQRIGMALLVTNSRERDQLNKLSTKL